ncbi:hypothetical protein GQ457_18G015900 [Hibiscus cannabinus]
MQGLQMMPWTPTNLHTCSTRALLRQDQLMLAAALMITTLWEPCAQRGRPGLAICTMSPLRQSQPTRLRHRASASLLPLDIFQCWEASYPSGGPFFARKGKSASPKTIPTKAIIPDAKTSFSLCDKIEQKAQFEALEAEAKECLEVCNVSGLFFKATDEEVCKRLVELEMRSGDNIKEKKAAVRRILSCNKASVLFIQESKLDSVNVRPIRDMGGSANNMDWLFSPAVGSAGGLISLWNPNVFDCLSSETQRNYIVLEGKLRFQSHCLHCILVNVYAPNGPEERKVMFNNLRGYISNFNLPIIVGGDFNVVRNVEERVGICLKKGEMQVFSEFIDSLCLIDLPASGGPFTWSNFRAKPSLSRIDRFLISSEVFRTWPDIVQTILPKNISDYNPISLSVIIQNWGPKPFKWFDHWADDKGLVESVRNACQKKKGAGIGNMLRECKLASKTWLVRSKQSEPDSISALESKITNLEAAYANGESDHNQFVELQVTRTQLWKKIRQDEREWLQKSRLKWFEAGDKNTRNFHIVASTRRRKISIDKLSVGSRVVTEPEKIKAEVEDHFQKIYNNVNNIKAEHLNCNLKVLSVEDANKIEEPFSIDEIWSVLLATDGSRAPGPDGFNMNFLKRFWLDLKEEICQFFSDFYHGKLSVRPYNHSFIVLISKTDNPASLEDYRPISLVGSVYKLLAKVLAARLNRVSNDVIGESQFAFCPGKQITDCSLIANEIIDYTKRRGLSGVVFKVDFRKAYDSVDWAFLIFVMKKMGFGSRWCSWIQDCISSTMISVLVNGSSTKSFNISRGLRQGCPLSPILFNLVAEALSSLLHKAVSCGLFNGIQVGNDSVEISHLQFADDLIIFCRDNESQIRNIVRILRGFELVSGLQINLRKSKLLGINVEESLVDSWASIFHCKSEKLPCIYLGLPLGQPKNSKQLWSPIVEKFKSKFAGWKSKLLSFGGRVTLIKSVISNLPMYYMSIFPMPASISKLLSKLIANFLWGSLENRAIHWVKWEVLCLPKEAGGLGLFDFKSKNIALRCKWLWRYGTEPNSLWRKTIAAIYESNQNALLPENFKSSNKSWIWRSIASQLSNNNSRFLQNVCYKVGGVLINDLVCHPSRFNSIRPVCEIRKPCCWSAPSKGFLKFNTDGAVGGSFGEAGIGGCLRDENSKTLLYFSQSAGVTDVITPEILALKEAIKLYSNSKWCNEFKVVFECDSELAVGWLSRPHRAPTNLKEILSSCLSISKGLDCSFHFVHRECNSVADGLAKKGIGRRVALVIVDPP